MDWQECMNQAIDYIENNLSDEIDYSIAAQHMNCSVWEFQRVFSFIAQVPLSEYIRKRRLTLAAHDIRVSKDKVIDVALRYGYDSPASFSRAFNQLHGTTPKSARDDGITLKVFPRLFFKFTLKGVESMDYKIVQKGAFKVIGRTKRMTTVNDAHYTGIGAFWQEWDNSDLYKKLSEKYSIDKSHCIDVSTPTSKPEEFDYTIGVLYNGVKNVDGLDIVTVPGGSYAIFPIPEKYMNDVGSFMSRIITETFPDTGYKLAGIDAEYYSEANMEAWFLVK